MIATSIMLTPSLNVPTQSWGTIAVVKLKAPPSLVCAILNGLRTTAVTLLAAVMLGGCSQRPPSVPEIPREVVGTHEGFRSGVPTSNNPPRR